MKKKNASTVEHYYSHCGRPEDKKKIFFSLFRYRRRPPPSTHRKEAHLSSLFFFFFFILLVGRSVGRWVDTKEGTQESRLAAIKSSAASSHLLSPFWAHFVRPFVHLPTDTNHKKKKKKKTHFPYMQMTVATTTYGSGGRGGSSTLSTAVSYYIHPS